MKYLLTAVCALALAGPVAAQDYNADPNYGDITLAPGFTPDPHLVSLRAGGDAIEREGMRRASGGRPTRDGLISGLESIRNYAMGGFDVSFSGSNHVASKYVELSMLTGDGRVRT